MLPHTDVGATTWPMDPEGATGTLCNWITGLQLNDVPVKVQERAKYLMLDGLGCALVGAQLPWSVKATNAVCDMEPASGSATIIGWDKKITPLSAALLNSSFIQGFELDDWHSEAPLHSNSIILPALFAAVEHMKQSTKASDSATINGSSFLLAYLVGLEVGPRVGNGLHGTDMLTRGWHSGAVFGPPVSASAVSKMLNLPASMVEDAIGIACTQAGGLMSAQYESEVKRMQHGFAARNGLFAALMARGGYIGIKKVFERPYGGYLAMFGQGSGKEPEYVVDEITKELGTEWKTWGCRVKPYAAMAGTHGSIDCVKKLQASHGDLLKDLSKIASIRLEMGEVPLAHGGWEVVRPLTSVGAQMSNSYVAATQLLDGQVLAAQFRHNMLSRDEVWALVDKSSCHLDTVNKDKWHQAVTITFEDGTAIKAEVDGAWGQDPSLTNQEIVDKWRAITVGVIDSKRMEKIERLCLAIDSQEDVTELIQLLSGVTSNPIA